MSIGPKGATFDKATKSAGATLNFAAPGSTYKLDIGNAALGVSNVTLSPAGSGVYRADLGAGDSLSLTIADASTGVLSWTTYGMWEVAMANGTRTQAAFVTGYQTPVASFPVGGFASYYGHVAGEVVHPQATGGADSVALSGETWLDADFTTGKIDGEFYNMVAGAQPWNSVSFMATISGAGFAGNTTALSAPGNSASLSGSATGTIAGMFFGPAAKEVGAVWDLSDSTGVAFGTIGGKYDPWGY